MEDLGFIILRHVNNERTNCYWMECYDSIRIYYPENPILIIDDASTFPPTVDKPLYKTTIINSEYPKRGELLPYLYYLKYGGFKCAVILHDSVFINSTMDFMTTSYKFIWSFGVIHNDPELTIELISKLKNNHAIYDLYNSNTWNGVFGCMTCISYNFLSCINECYDIMALVPFITDRNSRMCLERVLACILMATCSKQELLGDIHNYCRWNVSYEERNDWRHLPLIKVWTGR